MKKIVVAVVLLLLVLVVAPWGVGRGAEKRVNDGLDQLVKEAPYLSITERKWTGGWFRSEQEVTFEVLGPWTRALNATNILDKIEKGGAATQPESTPEAVAAEAEAAAAAAAAPADTPAPANDAEKPMIPPMKFTVRKEI